MSERRFKLITFIIAIFIAIFIGEIGLRIVRPERMDVSKYEDIYDKIYSPSKKGYVIALKPNMIRKRWGTEVKTNSYGERDLEYSPRKPEGVYRIAVIGDSVAFGYGIPQEKTFAKVLERELNQNNKGKYEVLLFGRPGYSISNVYFAYMDKVKSFNPDIIIYAMVLNDFESSYISEEGKERKMDNNSSPRRGFLKVLNRSFLGFFRRHSAIYNLMIDFAFKIFVQTKIVDVNEARALDCFYPESERFNIQWTNTKKWLLLLKETFSKDGKDFIVCLFPYQFQIDEKMLQYFKSKGVNVPDKDLLKIQEIIGQFAFQNEINFIDLSQVYKSIGAGNLYLKDDYGHPNELGHQVAAMAILDYLKKHQKVDS